MASSIRRVAVIAGAAQGIGRAIAERLAKDGLDLGLFDLPQFKELLEELANSLRSEFGTKVVTVYGSVAVESDVQALVGTVVKELGELYAVRVTFLSLADTGSPSQSWQIIANAGMGSFSELHESASTSYVILSRFVTHEAIYSAHGRLGKVARCERQGCLLLLQVRCHTAHQTGQGRPVDRRSLYCRQDRYAVRASPCYALV